MMNSDFADDLRQAGVVCKNEIKKFVRGKRLLLFGILIIAVILLLTTVPYLVGDGYEDSHEIATVFVMFAYIIIELAAVLFTATSLVSEFEERTALILFTKPIRKWSIFLGKLMASLIIVGGFTLIYYGFIAVFSLIMEGSIAGGICTSLLISLLGVFGSAGIAMLMSSVFKKGSTASIMTLVVIMLVLSLVASLLNQFGDISNIWNFNTALQYNMNVVMASDTVSMTDVTTACGVLVGYGVICNTVAYVLFRRRDF